MSSNHESEKSLNENNITVIHVDAANHYFTVKFLNIGTASPITLNLDSVPQLHRDKVLPHSQFNIKLFFANSQLQITYNFDDYRSPNDKRDKRKTKSAVTLNEDVLKALKQIVEGRTTQQQTGN